MAANRWAILMGLFGIFGMALPAQANMWSPQPYSMVLGGDGSYYYPSSIFEDSSETCSRSWADSCDVWIAETGGEVDDVTHLASWIYFDNEYIVDFDVYYYDVGPQFCWWGNCDSGSWSYAVDHERDEYAHAGYYGMWESSDPGGYRGPFDYDEETPLVRFDFTMEFMLDGTTWEYTKAIEIWTDLNPPY
jgi:hypothetical protein